MKLNRETAEIQNILGDYVRTGHFKEIPGAHEKHVKQYRRLVYNVVRDILDSAYPITLAALGEEIWDRLVNDFFSNHNSHSPQVWRLPLEFYEYHAENRTSDQIMHPGLDDLIFFEWMEIEIHTMPDIEAGDYTFEGDVLNDLLVINPEFEILRLEYPVHLVPLSEAELKKGEYHVLIYREPDTGRVRFMDLTSIHSFIIGHLFENGVTLESIKGNIATISGIESMKYLDEILKEFINDLITKKFILGFQIR